MVVWERGEGEAMSGVRRGDGRRARASEDGERYGRARRWVASGGAQGSPREAAARTVLPEPFFPTILRMQAAAADSGAAVSIFEFAWRRDAGSRAGWARTG